MSGGILSRAGGGAVTATLAPVASITGPASLFTDFGANAQAQVKASPGRVFSASCENLNLAANRFLQLHNVVVALAGGEVPLLTFLIPPLSQVYVEEGFFGADGGLVATTGTNFTVGIRFAFSTTRGTFTAGAAADQFTQIRFR